VKGRSIFSAAVSLAVLAIASVSVLAQGRSPSTNQQILKGRSLYQVAQQLKLQLITWKQFIEQGCRCFLDRDYDLPPKFRNSYVYINTETGSSRCYILKQCLSTHL